MNFSSCHSKKDFLQSTLDYLWVHSLSCGLDVPCLKKAELFQSHYNVLCFFLFIYNLMVHLKLVFFKSKGIKVLHS